MPLLSPAELAPFLTSHSAWTVKDGELIREATFADFLAAIAFVNRVAPLAEAAGHHPDLLICYNRVRLALVTHDAGGLTVKDMHLAAEIEDLLSQKS